MLLLPKSSPINFVKPVGVIDLLEGARGSRPPEGHPKSIVTPDERDAHAAFAHAAHTVAGGLAEHAAAEEDHAVVAETKLIHRAVSENYAAAADGEPLQPQVRGVDALGH